MLHAKNPQIHYSVADASKKLDFDSGYFDAIVVSFVLINIFPSALRPQVVAELGRVLKKGGFIWVNEPFSSPDYFLRYKLSRPYVDEDNSFFVFKKGLSWKAVTRDSDLQKAMADGMVDRVTSHFKTSSFDGLFDGYKIVSKKESVTASPNTGYKINMVTTIFQK